MTDFSDTLTETGFNALVERLTKGVSRAALAVENEELREHIDELSDLAHDQDEYITTLEAVCILHGWNPITAGSNIDEA